MEEFMLIFRNAHNPDFQMSPEQMQASIKPWQDWIGSIAAQGKFVSTNQLGFNGKTLRPGLVVTDGPYMEVKEIVGGYLIVKAESTEEAIEFAKGCPIIQYGGNVEVREIMSLN